MDPSQSHSNNPNLNPNPNPLASSVPIWPTIDGSLGLSEEESVKYARRFYKFGFALLPLLWAVNCFYFWPVIRHSHSFPRIRPYVVGSAVGFTLFSAVLCSWALTFSIGGERLFGPVWDQLVMYNLADRLEGKVAIITGSASGLGKATAHEFIQNGAQVIIADNNTQVGPQVAKELGPSAQYVECDVTVEAQIEEVVNVAITKYGKLDIMYNNAGITGPIFPPSIRELDLDEFEKVMRVNVTGVIAGIKHAARVMIPKGYGSIICTSSISGLFGGLGPHSYTISKSTILGVVKSVASELCKDGIRVNCISPAPIPTPMTLTQVGKFLHGFTQEEIGEMVSGLSVLKGAECETIDVARAALYLASDDSKFISGHNLIVDGAYTSFKNFVFASPD